MKQSNIDYLENNRDCLKEIQQAKTATKANRIKEELLRIMKEEFLPNYEITFTCGSCLFDMVRLLYQKFDQYLRSRGTIEKVQASFPIKQNNELHTSNSSDRTKRHPRRR